MAYPGNDPAEDRRTRDSTPDSPTRQPAPDRSAGSTTGRPGPAERGESGGSGGEPAGGAAPGDGEATRPTPRIGKEPLADRDGLYFFPTEAVGESRVRWILQQGSSEERAWVISHLLRYAQWDDIWKYVSRAEVKELFAGLDLPAGLRQAWARMLKIEAPVG